MMTDDEFFTATTELGTIRQWARARYAAPWAVFGAVLLRVAASTEPTVQLPGVIGGRASLNLLAAFVSASGGGKGISDKVARLAWPSDIVERPIGSGEGLAATFTPPKGDGVEPITRAIINVPEVDTLAGLASRQGSILLAQLKSVAMGEQIGQANASAATTRIVAAHSYRCCMSVGAQPGHTGVIFDDTTGGTPQRFLWFPTTDPDMPADDVYDPEPLDTGQAFWKTDDKDEDKVVEIGYGPPEIREQIIAAHLARQRGDADALDGHAMLTRCKVAAILAIMHKNSVVSERDWALSAVVMAKSDETRDWIVGEAKRAARQKVRERALARAAGDEVYDQRLLDRVKRSVEGMLTRDGEQAASDLRRRLGKREKRDLFDQAVAELEHDGVVESVPGRDRGSRFRIGHRDQPGHPTKSQVKRGDHFGHGDQSRVSEVLSESTGCTEVQGQSSQVREGVPQVQGVLSDDVEGEVVSSDTAGAGPGSDTPTVSVVVATVATGVDQAKRDVATGVATGENASGDTVQNSVPTGVVTVPSARPTRCRVCSIELPKAATEAVCEDCGDPAHRVIERPAKRPLHVVHDGRANPGSKPSLCPHCGDPLVYDDDRRDGYHTSKSKCVRAHKAGA